MKKGILENRYLNNGKKTWIFYPVSEDDIKAQIHEIFVDEYYRPRKLENNVCIDVGANIGLASLYLSNFCKQVYAIEPSPETYKALVMNASLSRNIKTFNHAIHVENSTLQLLGYNNEPPQATHPNTDTKNRPVLTSEIYVPCKTLETFMDENNIEKVDVLKIDVEGSEYEIFCDETFKKVAPRIDCIVGETHYTGEFAIPQLVEFLLREQGYKFRFIRGNRKNNLWKNALYTKGDVVERDFQFPIWTNFIAWK